MSSTTLPQKRGHVRVLELPLSEIRPSPENEKLYRPVSPNDPEVRALAQSIRENGVREPIVITRDRYIISGHRRYVASKMAGLERVPCRIENIHSTDPAFLKMLREYNRQRIKTLDEIVREEVVSANPEEAYRMLVKHRRSTAKVSAETISIRGEKRRWRISEAKQPFLNAIIAIINERREYWPLTDRQIHYALLNAPPLRHARKPESRYGNTRQCYKDACDIITRGRLSGLIPFRAISDETRPVVTWKVHQSAATFVRAGLNEFLKGYYRDLQQSQPNHIEIVGEKNTIRNIVQPVAMEYCIPMTLGRGYCSIPPRYDMYQRFVRSGRERLVILALSDFDPEGEDIAHSFARSMRDDFSISNIDTIKVALTQAQVTEMGLPPEMKAKATSSRYAAFVEEHGEDVFELEAIPPADLQAILREAIDSVLDVRAFNREIDQEKEEAAYLDGLRRQLIEQIGDV